MASVTKVKATFDLSNGKQSIINLPAPVSNYLTDPVTEEQMWTLTVTPVQAAFATDDGATVTAVNYDIIKTITTNIATHYAG